MINMMSKILVYHDYQFIIMYIQPLWLSREDWWPLKQSSPVCGSPGFDTGRHVVGGVNFHSGGKILKVPLPKHALCCNMLIRFIIITGN